MYLELRSSCPAVRADRGLVRPSFVPPPAIRELRTLTRYRRTQAEERTREVQRLDKVLQDAGLKRLFTAKRLFTLVGGGVDPNVTVVTRTGGGEGSYANGSVVMPIKLRIDQSIDLPLFEEDSTLHLVPSADAPGTPVDAGGNVTLAGTFKGGAGSVGRPAT